MYRIDDDEWSHDKETVSTDLVLNWEPSAKVTLGKVVKEVYQI